MAVTGLAPTGALEGTAFAQQAGAGAIPANGVGTQFELSFWQSVAGSNDVAQLQAYLAQYPNGTFSGLAKAKIAALSPAMPAPVVAPSAPSPVAIPVAPAAALPAPVPPITAALPPAPLPAAEPARIADGAAQPASQPVIAPAPPSPSAAPPSLLDQLAAVGKAGPSSTPALFTENGAVPPRPALAATNDLTVPDHFCSAVERNAFHDTVYTPAVAQADHNNEAAIAHLTNLEALHAQAIAANDVARANALAHEAIAFKPVATQAYEARMSMAGLFDRIMAVPVQKC